MDFDSAIDCPPPGHYKAALKHWHHHLPSTSKFASPNAHSLSENAHWDKVCARARKKSSWAATLFFDVKRLFRHRIHYVNQFHMSIISPSQDIHKNVPKGDSSLSWHRNIPFSVDFDFQDSVDKERVRNTIIMVRRWSLQNISAQLLIEMPKVPNKPAKFDSESKWQKSKWNSLYLRFLIDSVLQILRKHSPCDANEAPMSN